MTRPAGMKKLVPATRSRINSSRLGEELRTRVARCRGDEPGPRRDWHAAEGHPFGAEVERVAMKFNAPSKEPMQNVKMERPQRVCPCLGRAGVGTDGAERSVAVHPEMAAVGNEEGGDQETEREECGPEGHHVEAGEGHVLSAIWMAGSSCRRAKGALVRTKNHERAVHGQEGEVVLGS